MSNDNPTTTAQESASGARRDATREKAQELKARQKKRDTRNRVALQIGIVVAVLVVIALVVTVIVGASRDRAEVASPANMASGGIVIGAGFEAVRTDPLPADARPVAFSPDNQKPNIRIYQDYMCPACAQFEQASGEMLESLVESEAITLEYHPLSLLDNQSLGSRYSTRSANAASCVADAAPDQFYAYNQQLFINQPSERTDGLDDEEMKSLLGRAGIDDTATIEQCIDEGRFGAWVRSATDFAAGLTEGGGVLDADIDVITATPTIVVNGSQYTGSPFDPDELRQFIVTTAADEYATETPTPEGDGDE